jgi:predicted F0F1-ATPase subunit/F1F0 ATPase subunit 2
MPRKIPKTNLSESADPQGGTKESRKLKARREKGRSLWFGMGMFGLVGWSVAIPTLAGIALGVWVDTRWPGPLFLDVDAAGHRRGVRMPECLVLGKTGEQSMIKDLLVAVLCGGAGIGGIHFAGLWWTVRRIQTSRRPGLLVLTSFLVRAGLTVSALYLILGCMLGATAVQSARIPAGAKPLRASMVSLLPLFFPSKNEVPM